jgi:hypothetical protein
MASELSRFMTDYAGGEVKQKGAWDFSTRRRRRATIKSMITQLELMKEWEEAVRDNTPENLQGCEAYNNTEEAITTLENAIDALTEY